MRPNMLSEGSTYTDVYKYQISQFGNIRNKNTKQLLYQHLNTTGYKVITLQLDNNTAKSFRVNRLMALTFHENPNNKPVVDHKDRDTQNNHVDNLRWATYKENANNRTNTKKK